MENKQLTEIEVERIRKMTKSHGWKAMKRLFSIRKESMFYTIFNLDEENEDHRKVISNKKKEFKALETIVFDMENLFHGEDAAKAYAQDQEEIMKEILPEWYVDYYPWIEDEIWQEDEDE